MKTKLQELTTPETFEKLKLWVDRQQSGLPERARLSVKDYFHQAPHREYYSRQLEKIILKILNKSGCIATKVKNTGKYIDKRKTYTDVVGFVRTVGSAEWVRDHNVVQGMADIRADLPGGVTWYIEIKIKDRQSDVQREFQAKVEGLGHYYSIVRSVDDFIGEYELITKGKIL